MTRPISKSSSGSGLEGLVVMLSGCACFLISRILLSWRALCPDSNRAVGRTRPSSSSSSSSVSVSGSDADDVEFDEDDASAKPRVEYASEDWDEDELSFSPHSSEFFEPLWFNDSGARESCVRSVGKEKASSKSSSTESIVGFTAVFFAVIVGILEALIVETPSSSSEKSVDWIGGRILIIEEPEDVEAVAKEAAISDLAAKPATTAFAFAPPVLPRSISRSQSSSSSLSGAWSGAPSGKSKSASGHSSRGKIRVGAGMVFIVVPVVRIFGLYRGNCCRECVGGGGSKVFLEIIAGVEKLLVE